MNDPSRLVKLLLWESLYHINLESKNASLGEFSKQKEKWLFFRGLVREQEDLESKSGIV